MSKSKGEFLTVELLREKGYDPLAYRFFCLLSHYRKNLDFSYPALDNAASAYSKLVSRIAALSSSGREPDEAAVKRFSSDFSAALDNDLNTALAVTSLYDVLKSDADDDTKLFLIDKFDSVLSLGLLDAAAALGRAERSVSDADAAEIESMIARRLEAKKNRDFALADQIRDKLASMGVELTDTPQGTKWTRK